jgi:phospholipid/cholesterol/gamma-HCH transport system substrate-binding protein
LSDAPGDLATTINGLNTDQLNQSLATLAQTFSDTPPDLQGAVQGVARLSQTLNERDEQLRGLLANANKATAVNVPPQSGRLPCGRAAPGVR